MDMDNEHTFVTIDNDVNEVLLINVNPLYDDGFSFCGYFFCNGNHQNNG